MALLSGLPNPFYFFFQVQFFFFDFSDESIIARGAKQLAIDVFF